MNPHTKGRQGRNAKKKNLEGNLVEVAIQGSQHCLVSNNADTLALPLNFNDDWLQPLDDVKIALPTWIPT